jgi:hypothetical protein
MAPHPIPNLRQAVAKVKTPPAEDRHSTAPHDARQPMTRGKPSSSWVAATPFVVLEETDLNITKTTSNMYDEWQLHCECLVLFFAPCNSRG